MPFSLNNIHTRDSLCTGTIFCSAGLPFLKPHPHVITSACQVLGSLPSCLLSVATNMRHGITSSDRMEWYNVSQILLGSDQCLANCMNTLILLMSRNSSTTALCMPVTPARQFGFTLGFDHLTVCSYLKSADTMMVLLLGASNMSCMDRDRER